MSFSLDVDYGTSIPNNVGLADDRFGIRGRQKLLGQFLAATVLIIFGYQFLVNMLILSFIEKDLFMFSFS